MASIRLKSKSSWHASRGHRVQWGFLVCYEPWFIQFRQVVLVGELVRHTGGPSPRFGYATPPPLPALRAHLVTKGQ